MPPVAPIAPSSPGPWPDRAERALDWLRASIRACGGQGSAAWYTPLKGWGPAYPETTGYLIPTLLDWSRRTADPSLRAMALGCADWLLTVRHPAGSFPAGTGTAGPPSVFNTAMIMEGLAAVWKETGDDRYREALARAADWLLQSMDDKGHWTVHLHVPGYTPAYHLRIGWVLYRMGLLLGEEQVRRAGETVYAWHRTDILATEGPWIPQAAERPGQPAMLHFLAYVYDAALDMAFRMGDGDMVTAVSGKLYALARVDHGTLRLPGAVDAQGAMNYRFRCLTGEAQVAEAFLILHAQGKDPAAFEMAGRILAGIRPAAFPLEGIQGGIPGSRPLWGPYQRFRYINWAAKFYLDALGRFLNQRNQSQPFLS